MPLCRQCGKDWPAGYDACPNDGHLLEADTATSPSIHTPESLGVREADARWSSEPAVALNQERIADLEPGTRIGEYCVEFKLGEGGMGSVYAATHPLIGKKAAIKIISAALCSNVAAVERFVQEARAVNQIGHPNIVDVFSFGELHDGRSYFVMEWLQGETLSDRMARGRLPLLEAVEVLDQVGDALDAAHEKQIVHRDLKPANVFLMAVRGNRQLVKLLDFGLAKLADSDDTRLRRTRTGVMMGTPEYVSPEQARGRNVDHRTDIYALGAMAYEMFLGRLPFEADNAADIITKHLTQAPPSMSSIWPDIPPDLEKVVMQMLEKDPARRPTLHEVRAKLAELRGMIMTSQVAGQAGGFPASFTPRLMTPPAAPAVVLGTPLPGADRVLAPVLPSEPGKESTAVSVPFDDVRRGHGRGLAIAAFVAAMAVGTAITIALYPSRGRRSTGATPTTAPVSPPAPAVTPPAPAPAVAPPAPAPAPALGALRLDVKPAGARYSIDDGKLTGTATPGAEIALAPGEHEIDLAAQGRRLHRTFVVRAGETTSGVWTLERVALVRPVRPPNKRPPEGPKTGSGKTPPKGKDYVIDPFGRPDKDKNK